MSEWEVTYTTDRECYEVAIVRADTYTLAVLEFMTQYPNCDFTRVREI